MTPAEQLALQQLVGRALEVDEVAALVPLVAARNDIAIAAFLSVGRMRATSRIITARGVRGALPITDGSRFLRLLRDLAAATDVPTWLEGVLQAASIPQADHAAYLDTFACAHEWLQGSGLDLGDPTTRAMLDLIAAGNADMHGAVTALRALSAVADPIAFERVSAVLNEAGANKQ